MAPAPPKAFISHASEDKVRFVLGFATKLREKGIDAWLDRWEIKPGDSLVQKIFEEGIKNANAFLVVLSSNSISKPWVREELDSGVVRKIEKSCRLLPILIDDCEVPQAVKHLKLVTIRNLDNYPDELSEIVSAIFGTSDRPPIGTPPAHSTTTVVDYLPDLTNADNLVFAVLCRQYLKTSRKHIGINEVYDDLKALELSDEELTESLEILGSRGYAKLHRAGHDICLVELYTFSLDEFMRAEVKDYAQHVATVISKIVNEKQDSNTALHDNTGIPVAIILHILAQSSHKRKVVTVSFRFPEEFRTSAQNAI